MFSDLYLEKTNMIKIRLDFESKKEENFEFK